MDRVRRGILNLRFLVPLVSCLLILGIAGCAKPPQPDIDGAKASIDAATAAEAQDYAPQSLQAAKDSWNALQTELQAQESKFALFRSYKNAKDLAAQTKAAGDKAKADADAAKEKAKQDDQQMMTDAQASIDAAKAALDKAPKGKGEKEAIEALKNDLAGAEASLADANTLFQSGKYLQAKAKLQAAKNSADQVKAAVDQAAMMKKGAGGK